MKKLKDLKGIEILDKNQQKIINGGEVRCGGWDSRRCDYGLQCINGFCTENIKT
ncbi:hypothetical protein [Flavobacterium sp. N502540]|uniref:hypothetical protein n=1 Tax=Flavobacterium sp. N502540 TaxID=2986838 RepID=UPI002225A602|nr:hypothetical protein [Flavobacterium sp. N502540]